MLDHLETVKGDPKLERIISDFITVVKGHSPDIGHVMVVYDDTEIGATIGMGSITGVKDMNRCVNLLRDYVEQLEAGIPALH